MDSKPCDLLGILLHLKNALDYGNYPMPTGIQVSPDVLAEALRIQFGKAFKSYEAIQHINSGGLEVHICGVTCTCDPNLERGEYRLEYKLKDEK